ncbi:hypothetical protein Adt_09687 [Abeliophyllum distichum]|uniref:Uncharacterized protein n=1 Tax=Abeliophyllum distichum TaxID=126358 RepID=A0ABD1UIS9_9LAMI
MDVSGCHSSEKRKGLAHRSKEKSKKIRSVNLSYSVENLASVGEALDASRQLFQKEVPSYCQCITELVATSKVPKGNALYNFTLTFLSIARIEKGLRLQKNLSTSWVGFSTTSSKAISRIDLAMRLL